MSSSVPSRFERAATVLPLGYAPDWERVAAWVRTVDGPSAPAGSSASVEVEREALVVTFALFLGGDAPGRAGAVTRTSVRQLATTAGVRETRVRGCLHQLAEAGVLGDPAGAPLVLPTGAPAWDDHLTVRLADDVLRPAPTARAMQWDAVRARAGGSTRALAATAAFVDLLPTPGEWTSVSLAAVGTVARYAGRKVSEAVQRAVDCGVLEERRERGSANLYRFAAEVLHAGGAEVLPSRTATRAGGARSVPAAEVAAGGRARPDAVREPASRADGAATTMLPVEAAAALIIGGVTFPLPPGARPQLERDAEGRYWYRVGTMHLGPVSFD